MATPTRDQLIEQVQVLQAKTRNMLEYLDEGKLSRALEASHELADRAAKTNFDAIMALMQKGGE